MTFDEFDILFDKMVEEEEEIGKTKGTEYIRDGDRLDNFKRLGNELNLSPKKILWIYLKKHLDSILMFINDESMGNHVLSEPIEGRIKDARVYLSLLRGLIDEDGKETK